MKKIWLLPIGLSLAMVGFAQDAATPKAEVPPAETSPAAPAPVADRGKSIYLIPKGSRESVWKLARAGAIQAGKDFGVKIVWRPPLVETDVAGQAKLLDQAASADGILLAPIDGTIVASGSTPLVVFDSPMKGGKELAFVGSDYAAGGELAAKRLGEILSGKGRILLLKHDPKNAATLARENGFKQALIKEFPDIKIVGEQFGGGEREKSATTCEQLLVSGGDVNAIFASSEASTYGALAAIAKIEKLGQMKVIGSDASARLVDSVVSGSLDALVMHHHFKMGYEGVKAIVDTWDGKTVEKKIEIPPVLVTKDNASSSEVKEMIPPDVR